MRRSLTQLPLGHGGGDAAGRNSRTVFKLRRPTINMICLSCNEKVKYTTEALNCSNCKGLYHHQCVNITTSVLNVLKCDPKRVWISPLCSYSKSRGKSDNTPVRKAPEQELEESIMSCDGDSGHDRSMANVNVERRCAGRSKDVTFLQDISVLEEQTLSSGKIATSTADMLSNTMERFQKMFDNLSNNMQALSLALTACREEVSGFRSEITEMKNKIQHLEQNELEVKTLRQEVQELRSEIVRRDRMYVLNDVEISGVTEHKGENVEHIVGVLAAKLGVQLDMKDVVHVSRVGKGLVNEAREDLRPRPIVLRLTRRAPRDDLIRAARVRRNLSTSDIDVPGTRRAVYVNEHLIKHDRRLLGKARALAREQSYKYVWRRNGQILLRKTENGDVYRINSDADLISLPGETQSKENFRS